MSTDLLDPSALVSALPNLLSSKSLPSPHDGLAALVHTAFVALGFRLIAVDDSSPPSTILNGLLPSDWNKHPGNSTFRYRHEQSSLEFIVKVAKLGSRTVMNAIAVEVWRSLLAPSSSTHNKRQSDKAASLDISTNDFVSPSFFPYDGSVENPPPLVHGFISSNRIADLMSQFKLKVVSKLIPGLHKEGYTEVSEASVSATRGERPPASDLRARRRSESPTRGPDPYFRLPSHIPSQNPLEIGRRDLDPLGLGGANPFAPPPMFPGSGGDGMFVGPDHPIFGQRGRGNGGNPMQGPWGGDGYLPPMGAPPGARFDPVGPGLGPFPGRSGFGPRGGQQPGQGNMRGPDNDEFMPPGAGDMFM
ncbi:hypothetical protein FA95DRAFT_1552990 [Auriscalpium vulgare]|uniref:Uncharacterized protein n=1 Tax=Auriscalpium vulgare TaxID=40419 RepID=A0ACB8SB18_9AGAM|nr:hypothetical protein FA95DRAFT_1552990 [Auriscalpium vulgare]